MKTLIEFWGYLGCKDLVGLCLLASCLLTAVETNAQQDSLRMLTDTIATNKIPTEINPDTAHIKRLDPRKALLYSAVLPGLGQIYNGKYWKLPFVYGGFVAGIMIVDFYQKIYVEQRDDLYTLLSTGNSPSGRTESNLRFIVDKARRERDYFLIITGLWYFLQIVDAHVDAHLQEFKWNKEMKISLRPSVEQDILVGRTVGLTLTYKF